MPFCLSGGYARGTGFGELIEPLDDAAAARLRAQGYAGTLLIGAYQAELDATLFRDSIAKPLHISARYLGEEPTSKTTAAYNAALSAVLAPQVAVKIIPRHTEAGQIVSATTVRQAILAGDQDQLARLLPPTTLTFVKENFADLQARIQKKGSK